MPRRSRTSSPLADRVYDGLLDDLTSRRRGAGDRLVEAEIAREMDVSRTPVREALSRLENDGLITGTRPGGYAIITPSIDDIREIFDIRRALEPMAFASVVRGADATGDVAITEALATLRQARTMPEAIHANIGFRGFWIERIANRRLRETLRRFDMQVQIVRAATLYTEEARTTARDGAARLAQTYLDRDAEAAETAMRAFVEDAFRYFERADAENLLHTRTEDRPVPGPNQPKQQSAND
jgi:Transcriptional regulators